MADLNVFKKHKEDIKLVLDELTNKGDKDSFNFQIIEFALSKYAVFLWFHFLFTLSRESRGSRMMESTRCQGTTERW